MNGYILSIGPDNMVRCYSKGFYRCIIYYQIPIETFENFNIPIESSSVFSINKNENGEVVFSNLYTEEPETEEVKKIKEEIEIYLDL